MTYQIPGIRPDQREKIASAPGTFRVSASGKPGFPCRSSDAITARRAMPGEADRRIRQLFEPEELVYIDGHNAAYGCFAARVERA